MIYGMGCDIAQVSRIEKVFEKPAHLSRCFTPRECAYLLGHPQRIAGAFAAKEAFAKALGTGFRGFTLLDVEVLRDEWGRPFITADSLRKVLTLANICDSLRVLLSISHEKEYAVATCILERAHSH
ncbi:Holo-[acyl-carrier protein] synthase [Clostridiaceae bacterium JG1575]|nr:Holo-[acyl-carrier protein] synthase [Clostridiaceae bacterium JG1575]